MRRNRRAERNSVVKTASLFDIVNLVNLGCRDNQQRMTLRAIVSRSVSYIAHVCSRLAALYSQENGSDFRGQPSLGFSTSLSHCRASQVSEYLHSVQ